MPTGARKRQPSECPPEAATGALVMRSARIIQQTSFVLRRAKQRELDHWRTLSRSPELSEATIASTLRELRASRRYSGNASWTLQTYFRLALAGFDPTVSNRLERGRICILHYDDGRLFDHLADSFVVAIQPDRPRWHNCHLSIRQNQASLTNPSTDFWVPYWPQPGLVPRDDARGDRVVTVAYQGHRKHLAPWVRDPEFRRQLASRGLHFVHRSQGEWHDYHDVDVVLAVRSEKDRTIAVKPASKLQNAWLAGCVALLGPEPAFRELRRHPDDYLEVRGPEDTLRCLDMLSSEPTRFRAMRSHAQERAREFTAAATTQRWLGLLTGPIGSAYERWRRAPAPLRRLRALSSTPRRAANTLREHLRYRRMYTGSERA